MHRAIVKGRVQGVGFRAVTKRLADQKGLQGTVRNLPDGNVEIILSGSRATLEQLLQDLTSRFPPGYIDKITIDSHTGPAITPGFTVL